MSSPRVPNDPQRPCPICGGSLLADFRDAETTIAYIGLVCRKCDARAVNLRGTEPRLHGFDDDGDNPVFIDSQRCWRRYRFGGWVTMVDPYGSDTLEQFYNRAEVDRMAYKGPDHPGQRPLPNSYWVIPGRLAAGEYPGARNPKEAASRLRALLRSGIDHFIDLTRPQDGLVPYVETAKREAQKLDLSLGWDWYPIIDQDTPRDCQQMVSILDAIEAAMGRGKTVYLHCWGGVGRTGTVVGCWLVRRGSTGEQALEQIKWWWQFVAKYRRARASPETDSQRDYVRQWAEPSRGG